MAEKNDTTIDSENKDLNAPRQKVKRQRIRDLQRFLKKRGDSMPPGVKEQKEKELKQLEEIWEKQEVQRKRVEKEKKLTEKYKMVKFFERRKVTRRIQTLEKQLEKLKSHVPPETEDDDAEDLLKIQKKKLQDELLTAKNNLLYILHFPKNKRYISLFGEDAKTIARREKIKAKVLESLKDVPEVTEEETSASMDTEGKNLRDMSEGNSEDQSGGKREKIKTSRSPGDKGKRKSQRDESEGSEQKTSVVKKERVSRENNDLPKERSVSSTPKTSPTARKPTSAPATSQPRGAKEAPLTLPKSKAEGAKAKVKAMSESDGENSDEDENVEEEDAFFLPKKRE